MKYLFLTLTLLAVAAVSFSSEKEGEKLKVAVIDSGAPSFGVDDICGKYNVTDSSSSMDKHGHGSNIARLIEKNAEDSNYCQVHIKIFTSNKKKKVGFKQIAKAFKKAISENVDIINISAGGKGYQKKECKLVKKALEKDIKIIAAAGNNRENISAHPYYPASCDERIIVVGCSNLPSSNYGPVDYTLPCTNKGLQNFSGTSQATAIFSGKLLNYLSSNKGKEDSE